MKTVGIYEAKTHLSRLIDEAVRGEEIIISRNGEPIVELKPVKQSKPSDYFGMDEGKYTLAPDFDEPLEDFKEYME